MLDQQKEVMCFKEFAKANYQLELVNRPTSNGSKLAGLWTSGSIQMGTSFIEREKLVTYLPINQSKFIL